jgi:N-acetylmuramoyl-L-alanine amidase
MTAQHRPSNRKGTLCLCLLAAALAATGCVSGPTVPPPSDWQDSALTSGPSTESIIAKAFQPQVPTPVPSPPVILPPVVAPPAPRFAETWVPLQRWSATEHFSIRRLTPSTPPGYVVESPRGAFSFRTGREEAQWNGLDLRLGFSPQMINGQPYMHTLDLSKTLQPLLGGVTSPVWGDNPIIVLDPGHGGSDSGTKSVESGQNEKEFTLDWAQRLQKLLVTNGWRVFLTRSNDSDLSLTNRVTFADDRKASIFLSLHFNSAAPNRTESGLETYCLTPSGMPSSLTRGSDDVTQSYPNNAFDTQNLLLALDVHRALLQVNGHRDRGVRWARFPRVLQGQQCTAILVEGGYLSNPQEARLIGDPAYRQKLAEAVARALNAHCRVRTEAASSSKPQSS